MKHQHILNFIFAGAIVVMASMNIVNSNIWHHEELVETEVVADSAKDVNFKAEPIKKDSMTFGEEMVEAKFFLKELPDELTEIDNIPSMEVAYDNGFGRRYGQTLVRYDTGMPKIVVYWFESKADKKMHRLPFMDFLDKDGKRLAELRSLSDKREFWICTTHTVDDNNNRLSFFFKDPNLCRDLNK